MSYLIKNQDRQSWFAGRHRGDGGSIIVTHERGYAKAFASLDAANEAIAEIGRAQAGRKIHERNRLVAVKA